jgi:hypothetical protein
MSRKSDPDGKDESVAMAADTIGGDLLNALMQEVRLMPDIWPKLPQAEQEEIIDRLRKRVADNIREATRLIASAGRLTVVGELKKITFGDKVVATLEFGKQDPTAMDLCHVQGMAVLLVVSAASAHIGGLDGVHGDPNQPDLPGVDGGGAAQIIEQASRRSKKPPKPADDGAIDPLH